MPLDVGDIDTWDTGALEEFARQLDLRSRALAGLGEGLSEAARIPDWAGLGADGARVGFDRLAAGVADRAATVGAVTELVTGLIDQVKALQAELDAARDEADAAGLRITDAGTVVDAPGGTVPGTPSSPGFIGPVAGEEALAVRAARVEARAALERRVRAILDVAADVEEDTTRVLTRAAEGGFTADGMSTADAVEKGRREADDMVGAPEPPTDVHAQQHYLDALSPDQVDELIRERPEWLANAYGIDPTVREHAAHAYLPRLREDLEADRVHTLERLEALMRSDLARPAGLTRELEDRLTVLDDQLADLAEIEAVTAADPDARLLGLRPHDTGVGAVVARGDIATADHVAVHVPGMGTETRDNPDAGNDLSGQMDKLRSISGSMREHLTLDDRPHETIATMTYLNMDFPDGLTDAADGSYADAAAPDLAAMLDGVSATSAGDPNLTVLGHSYGSLVTSEALQVGGTVDNVVFYGSPGLESSGDDFDPASLGVDPGNAYIMLAPREPIQAAHWLDPYGGTPHENSDLTRLDTSADEDRRTTRSLGHSQYELSRSTSLWNIGAVAAGNTDEVVGFDRDRFDADNYRETPFGRVPLVEL